MLKKLIYNLCNKIQRQVIDDKIRENLKNLNIPLLVKVYNSKINGNVIIGDYAITGVVFVVIKDVKLFFKIVVGVPTKHIRFKLGNENL